MALRESRELRNPRRKFVVTPATNGLAPMLSPVPPRFSSTTDPVRVSIVRSELSSVTEPSYVGNVFSNGRSVVIP